MDEIEKKSYRLLSDAFETQASDIHFIPRKTDVLVELRIQDHLYELDILSLSIAEKLITHFKFMSSMDLGEKRRPQNGAMEIMLKSTLVFLRLSTLPTPYSESLVIRLLPQTKNLLVSDLSIFSESTDLLLSFLNCQSGLILIAGPTGSGKTTTLYTLLSAAKRRFNSRIITLEDPIEKRLDGFVQMEINEKMNVNYADGFKAVLRHDPDIVMVGEIRDVETARIAVRASLSGHLVLSTIHAAHAPGTIQRLVELGIPKFDLKECLLGVVAQRLVTLKCPDCGVICKVGCRYVNHIGRTGIYEILTGLALHEYLKEGKKLHRLQFKTLDDYQRQGISQGLIPGPAEIIHEASDHHVFP